LYVPRRRLQNVYWANPANTGDMASAPLNFVRFEGFRPAFVDMRSARPAPDDPLILGGGGLLQEPTLRPKVEAMMADARAPVVLWGMGFNTNGMRDRDNLPPWIARAALAGLRDALPGVRWVPCTSCLHEAFNRRFAVRRQMVSFEGNPLGIEGLPRMACRAGQPIERILAFLGSAEVVVTSSYHGMYWATLLGRRVVLIPNADASKFFHFPFPAALATLTDWRSAAARARPYPEALEACREANRAFARDVAGLLGTSAAIPVRRLRALVRRCPAGRFGTI